MIRTALALAIGLGGLGWTTGGWAEGEQLLLGREATPDQPLPPNDNPGGPPPQPVLDVEAGGNPQLAALQLPPAANALQAPPAGSTLPPAEQSLPAPPGELLQSEPPPAAGPVNPSQDIVIDAEPLLPPSYFSPRLGAAFQMEQMFLPQFGHFTGARIVSDPLPGSPLLQPGLGAGDVITRLDGIPLIRVEELERHVLNTSLRFIRNGEQHVCRGMMFVDPYACFGPAGCWPQPACPLSASCGNQTLQP